MFGSHAASPSAAASARRTNLLRWRRTQIDRAKTGRVHQAYVPVCLRLAGRSRSAELCRRAGSAHRRVLRVRQAHRTVTP